MSTESVNYSDNIVTEEVGVCSAEGAITEPGYPTTLYVDHPGVAAMQADALELRWADAGPLTVADLTAMGTG